MLKISQIFQGDHFENLPNIELLKIQTARVLHLLCRGIGAGPEAALRKLIFAFLWVRSFGIGEETKAYPQVGLEHPNLKLGCAV